MPKLLASGLAQGLCKDGPATWPGALSHPLPPGSDPAPMTWPGAPGGAAEGTPWRPEIWAAPGPRSPGPGSAGSEAGWSDETRPSTAEGPESPAGATTTLMVRNLPNRVGLERLRAHFKRIYCTDYDSIYMPSDPRTGMNRGYCFVHFASAGQARAFAELAEGTQVQECASTKRLAVSAASQQRAAVRKDGSKTKPFGAVQGPCWIR